MLYIAADREVAEQARGPLTVVAVDADMDAKLASSFSKPYRRFIGVRGGCSCDFPSVMFEEPQDYFDGIFQDVSEEYRAHSVTCIQGLLDLIADALSPGETAELLLTWSGHEAIPPKGRIALRVKDVVPQEFFFIEQFLCEVRRE